MNIYLRLIVLSLTVCLTFCTAGAQKLSVDNETVDCGNVAYQVPATAQFTLKNTTSKRLTITEVKPDCGCTSVKISKKVLSSGEKTTLDLTYDARMLGHFVKQAAVYTDVSDLPLCLTMKGVVMAELEDYSGTYPYTIGHLLADTNVIEFDNVNKGDKPQQIIRIMNNGTTELTPNVQHLPSYLSAEVSPTKLRPRQAGTVTLTLDSKLIHGFGLTQTTVFLAGMLGEKVHQDNEIPVSIVALPDMKYYDGKNKQFAPKLELSADTVTLGVINGKKHKSETVMLSNKGRTELEISSIQMFTQGLQITLDKSRLQPNEQAKLKITADRAKLLKSKTKPRILMITNDPDHAKIIINVIVK